MSAPPIAANTAPVAAANGKSDILFDAFIDGFNSRCLCDVLFC